MSNKKSATFSIVFVGAAALLGANHAHAEGIAALHVEGLETELRSEPEMSSSCSAGTPGSDGVGDPFLPQAGNGGYDVEDYDLDLRWDPVSGELSGRARILAWATQDLSAFNLDLVGLTVDAVRVNYTRAHWTRDGQELSIIPARSLGFGDRMRIVVEYHGVPQARELPGVGPLGWRRTDDGASALSQPNGSPTWFPVNDHPSDKATFSLSMTVPKPLKAVSNGRLGRIKDKGSHTRFTWHEEEPMASYLATVVIGNFEFDAGETPGGIPWLNAVDTRLEESARPALLRQSEILDWAASLFGEYPLKVAGATIDHTPEFPHALETQSRPVYPGVPDDTTLVHEIAHQWFGNSVTVAEWPEIWLSEGFATFAEFLWTEHEFGITTRQTVDFFYANFPEDHPLWSVAPGPDSLPGIDVQFAGAVYLRGAMTLAMLRERLGDAVFFNVLSTWAEEKRHGLGTTEEFIDTCESISGQDLTSFFSLWLSTPGRPSLVNG